MYEFFFDFQRWILLCLLKINIYMNWLAVVWNHYRVVYFKIFIMVYFNDNIYNHGKAGDRQMPQGGR